METKAHDHHGGHAHHHAVAHGSGPAAHHAIDPVCGMSVDPATAKHHAAHDGRDYYFCSAKCRERFVARPENFLDEAPRAAGPAQPDAIYTCPMHPEIEQVGPGTCPICGMALEPKGVPTDAGPSEDYLDMRRRFIGSAILAVPLAVMVMLRHFWPAAVEGIGGRTLDWI